MRDSNNYRLEQGAGKGGNFYRGTQNLSRYDMTDPIGPRQKSNYGHDWHIKSTFDIVSFLLRSCMLWI